MPYVEGFQRARVLTVMKHFGLNNQEDDRERTNAIVRDERVLWEAYHAPYAAAVGAGVAAAMCSYNLVNGTHACSNSQLLASDLKVRAVLLFFRTPVPRVGGPTVTTGRLM